MNIKQILIGAKATLEECGWIQGVGLSDNGRMCAGYAIDMQVVKGDLTENSPEERRCAQQAQVVFQQAATELTGRSWTSIPDWNDYLGRSVEEVLLTFDHAIKLAEASDGERDS